MSDDEPETTSLSEAASEAESTTPNKYRNYIVWGVGILFVLAGLSGIAQMQVVGVIMLLLGLFILPPIRTRLEDTISYEFSRLSVIGIVILGMAAAGAAAPATGNATNQPSASNPSNANAQTAPTTEHPPQYTVRIIYEGSWTGAVTISGGGESKSRSIQGSGTETIEITGPIDIISANAQKKADNRAKLTIQILHNGEVVTESSTTAEYGVAQVSESFY